MSVDNPELDVFSEEALTIASKLHQELPNTHNLLYRNGVIPELLQFFHAYYKAQASKDMAEIIGRDLIHREKRTPMNTIIYNNSVDGVNAFKQEQRKAAIQKGYKLDEEKLNG